MNGVEWSGLAFRRLYHFTFLALLGTRQRIHAACVGLVVVLGTGWAGMGWEGMISNSNQIPRIIRKK